MKFKEVLIYKKGLKSLISFILIVLISWLHIVITQPCKNPIYRMCDYAVGFPVSFWIVTDYINTFMLIWFFIGIFLNFTIWYLFISFIFHKFKIK